MAIAGAQYPNASHCTFADVTQNQQMKVQHTIFPSLESSFSSSKFISSTVQFQVQSSREQLQVLATIISSLLRTLDVEYHAGRLLEAKTSVTLKNLNSLLEEIARFIQDQSSHNFLKSLVTTDERIAQIECFYRQIETLVTSFQILALVDIQDWQHQNEQAQMEDQKVLHKRLDDFESHRDCLVEMLSSQQYSLMAMMVSLDRRIKEWSGGDRERRFLMQIANHLSTISGCKVQWESWMVTSFDVEFGLQIGFGACTNVFEGTWKKTRVALKILRLQDGTVPDYTSLKREIQICSKLRHPRLQQFIGANVLDNRPFIVTPYLENGDARVYIQNHPDCDCLKILLHVSCALEYLHSNDVVHGNLKATNVLIDREGNAVLCDFGLASMRADMMSRTTAALDGTINVTNSRNWTAPELLTGTLPSKGGDIYSFGMTTYEIYANETPLNHISPSNIYEMVMSLNIRPPRPEDHKAPQLIDEVWKLAERCWRKDPSERPTANIICNCFTDLFFCRGVSSQKRKPPSSASSLASPAQPSSLVSTNSLSSPSQFITASQANGSPNVITEEILDSSILQPQSASQASDLLSLSGGPSTYVTFINNLDVAAHLYWVDFTGEPEHYYTLPPGQSHKQHTFVNHPWLVCTGPEQSPVAVFHPLKQSSRALIDASLLSTVATASRLEPMPASVSESNLRSLSGGDSTSVTFVNTLDVLANIYWINYDGERVLYRTLLPGLSYRQQTYVRHPWVVCAELHNIPVAMFQPTQTESRAVIRAGVHDEDTAPDSSESPADTAAPTKSVLHSTSCYIM